MVTDTYDRANALRNALMQMSIRCGTSISRLADAAAGGRREDAERHRRAKRRQLAAIQRLANALAQLSTGANPPTEGADR